MEPEKVEENSVEEIGHQTPPGAMEIRVNPLSKDASLFKVVRDGALDYCALFVKTQGSTTTVRIFKLVATGI